jgi:hypothetical protein
MTNVNATVKEISPLGGATLGGYKLGWLVATTKAAQNDTITITNAKAIDTALLQIVASGVAEANTVSTNVITCTSATGSAEIKGLIIYR